MASTPLITPTTSAKISALTQRILAGEEVPPAELAEAIREYREFRQSVATLAQTKTKAKAAEKVKTELPADILTTLFGDKK